MLSPANLFRMMTEMIFVLLGGFLVWLGLTNRLMFDPRQPAWLGLGAVLIYWGARSWIKTQRFAKTAERTATRVGGASLALVGFTMLSLAIVQLRWAGTLLAMAGALLAVRGLVSAVLLLRTS